MKKITTFLTATLTCTSAFCQKADSVFVSIGQDTGSLETQRFADRYAEVFGTYEPSRWLFKLDATSLVPAFILVPNESNTNFEETGLRLDAEYKISRDLSLNVSYGLGFSGDGNVIRFRDFSLDAHHFRVEPRWYYNMSRRIREGRSANNFSGNYFGIEFAQTTRIGVSADFEYRTATVRYGIQRRLFRYGYFDMSYGLGMRATPQTAYHQGSTQLFGDARLGIGLALAAPKSTRTKKFDQCDVLQCFREESRMWKIDLFNLFRIVRTGFVEGSLRTAVEQKIGGSPFSVEAQLQMDGSYLDQPALITHSLGTGGHLQSRYYYNLKRRIARGKSGNNLSGGYVAWQADWHQSHTTYKGLNVDGVKTKQTETYTQMHTGPLLGIQYRIFEKGFIDFNLGAAMGTEKTSFKGTIHPFGDLIYLTSALRIGVAF